MYKRETAFNKDQLIKYAYEDLGLNYFVLLGLSISKMVYEEVIYFSDTENSLRGPQVILFKRRSGNLQLICRGQQISQGVREDLRRFISGLDFKELITSQKHVAALEIDSLFSQKTDGALISRVDRPKLMSSDTIRQLIQTSSISNECLDLRMLAVKDVDAIERLYKRVFDSFTPPKIMIDKLESGRGRGFGLYKNNQLISVAQTDFETNDEAIIVGVATDPDEQHKGYGYLVMSALCQPLISEGKALYLHYNNPVAGKLYEKMGFRIVDQIGHYRK